MASASSGLNVGPSAAGGAALRDPFASPPRKQAKSEPEVPPSARSTGTAGTRYSFAAPLNLDFKPSPSRPGDAPPSYTIKYAAPEVLRNGGFQSKSVEKRAMEDASNKLAMLLFDTVFQKKLRAGNAEAKATVENLERLKRGEFRNGNFPPVKILEPIKFLDMPPLGPPPPLAQLRIKKIISPPSPINEEEKPETQPKKRKSRKTRKSKKSRKTQKLKNRKHK
jgi:hypothetical protein